MLAEVNAKSLTVEIGACAQHRRTGARLARDIGEGIRRIGHDEGVPHWPPPADPLHDLAIDRLVPGEVTPVERG